MFRCNVFHNASSGAAAKRAAQQPTHSAPRLNFTPTESFSFKSFAPSSPSSSSSSRVLIAYSRLFFGGSLDKCFATKGANWLNRSCVRKLTESYAKHRRKAASANAFMRHSSITSSLFLLLFSSFVFFFFFFLFDSNISKASSSKHAAVKSRTCL